MLVTVSESTELETTKLSELDKQQLAIQAEKYTSNPTPDIKLRIFGFTAILIGGLLGAVTGYALSKIITDNIFLEYISIIFFAILTSVGVAIVVSLGMQARPEWQDSEKKTKTI